MRTVFILPMIIICFLSCKKDSENHSFQNQNGFIDIQRCFCSSDYFRYLIKIEQNAKISYYNPINLPENFKDMNYKIVFSGDLLNDSSIVYTNTATDALIPGFKVRNIKLAEINIKSDLLFTDTLTVSNGGIYNNYENSISLQMDSVLEDSRCPLNTQCIWEGNGRVRFYFTIYSKDSYRQDRFILNTANGFKKDTSINGYKIQMIGLHPYPVYPNLIKQNAYKAKMIITN